MQHTLTLAVGDLWELRFSKKVRGGTPGCIGETPGREILLRKLAILGSTVALAAGTALVAAPAAGAATNVVTCTPAAGQQSSVAVSPAMVNNTTPDAAFGLKLSTVLDGCTANAPQLSAWVASKNGTPDGASIAKASLSLKAKGFGTCNFAAPDTSAYPANGSMSIKWLTSAGAAIASAKPSSAIVRVSGDLATVSAKTTGIVSKGLGAGADLSALVGFDLANPANGPVLACNTGPYSGPAVTTIALITTPTSNLTIQFP